MFKKWRNDLVDFYGKNEKALEIGVFVVGFLIDIVMMSEVDDLFSLAQQVTYLFVIAVILHYEVLFRLLRWRPHAGIAAKMWRYRNLVLHFLLGTLLSIYSLFYIKSASLVNSLVFLAVMIGLLVGNELPIFKKAKVSFKMGLFVICLFSFISILYPLVLGFVGWTPFGLSIATTLGLIYLQVRTLKKSLPDEKTLFGAILFPGVSVIAVFTLFYFAGWIPPVPLSAKFQGVYHLVEKRDGHYFLSTQQSWWRVWSNGDQNFKARPGDKIFYFAQIYSPARFADQIYIRWMFRDPKTGWQKTDRIPLQISGGRADGFRAVATKSNYQPGEWRVQIETTMGHEISRLHFEVTNDDGQENRQFEIIEK